MSLEELFKLKFPKTMARISFDDLKEISDRVLIVVDGLDELKDLYLSESSSASTRDNLNQSVLGETRRGSFEFLCSKTQFTFTHI